MTNIDIESKTDAISSELARQVFDGTGDDAVFSKLLASRLGVSCPVQLRAIQHRHLETPAPPRHCRALPVHDRLVAWVGKKLPAPPSPYVSGDAFDVKQPGQLIAALRLAIVSMRQEEMKNLSQEGRAYLSPEDERELVQLTLQALRHTPAQALPLATTCCQALAFRHSRILNSLRRKLLELLSAATAPIGVHSELSHRYIETVQRVLTTYSFTEFIEWFPGKLVQMALLAEEARRESSHSHSPLVSEALHHLEHRFTSPISLEDTARALHVSKEHLARRFKLDTGVTVVVKLNHLRIEAAQEQLSHSALPLKTIAAACGFKTLENFQRLFKRITGMSPGRYRKARE